jgi:hypothetical protein
MFLFIFLFFGFLFVCSVLRLKMMVECSGFCGY